MPISEVGDHLAFVRIVGVLILSHSFLVLGCGGGRESSVSGTVTVDAQPLPGGSIMFQPVDGGALVTSAIRTDGSYQLKTGARGGLAAGQYVVTVQSLREIPAPGMTADQLANISRVPLRYGDPQTSELRFEVKAGRNNINVALQGQ